MAIVLTRPPLAPSTLRPETFAEEMDARLVWQDTNVDEMQAVMPLVEGAAAAGTSAAASAAAAAASAASALAAPGTSATSTTSLAIGGGQRALTIQTGKSIVPGMWLNCVRTADRDKRMLGYVDSYISGTGALVLVVAATDVNGSGTFSDWTLSLSAVRGSIFNAVDLALMGPSIRPTLLCDFANSKSLDPRFTYTMTSPLSYYDALGTLRTAAAGQICFDHDPVTGRCLGIPMWEARTNQALRSQEFDNAVWTKTNCTISANAATAPDGTLTADSIVENSGAGAKQIYQLGMAVVSGAAYTCSKFFKAAGRSRVYVELAGTVFAAGSVYFDLGAGTKNVTGAATAEIVGCGNGWYRCSVTSIAIANGTTSMVDWRPSASGGDFGSYVGLGTSSLYAWGAQAETGACATPYIPTTSAAVARALPTLSMLLSASDFNTTEGTLHVEFTSSGDLVSACAVELSDGTAANMITINAANSSGIGPYGEAYLSSVSQAAMTDGNLIANTTYSAAIAWRVNDFAFCRDGRGVVTDTSAGVPALTTLLVGRSVAGNCLNGWLPKVDIYPKRLSNVELISLTTQ